jgi:hypothetical protein
MYVDIVSSARKNTRDRVGPSQKSSISYRIRENEHQGANMSDSYRQIGGEKSRSEITEQSHGSDTKSHFVRYLGFYLAGGALGLSIVLLIVYVM